MKNASDKRSSKFFLLTFLFLCIYLAFFAFDFRAAYTYTVEQTKIMLELLGF